MGYRVTFDLGVFDDRENRENLKSYLQILLDTLFQFDILYLREHPQTPLLYDSGVFYLEEKSNSEDWRDIPNTLRKGNGDCEDLACWRAAELVVKYNVDAYPFATYQDLGKLTLFHVLVWTPYGIEDPSRELGML